ncbi:hypothetical protein EDD98_1448 [Streptomyces sp. PanSC19]|uniref:hypothetical protein n=1 Tax=Streptomyces sp. PanSC19 TaxID=1520455 RepID=UPI000F91EC71|nr:hypothetical protein [Streptomyces sp. PanSC19]ROQ32464.1 hypothetical protein EDD98_1448 [Streptomyces sp. PanSC19]
MSVPSGGGHDRAVDVTNARGNKGMKWIKSLAMTGAAVVLTAGQLLAGTASAAPAADRADGLQRKVDAYLASHPGERQLGEGKATMPGGSVTFSTPGTADATAISCSYGHLCIQDGNGSRWDYYYCGYYDFSGVGDGYFNNNQTSGTVARFYNNDGSLRWTSRAPQSGTASWTPVYHIRPC